MDNLIIIAQEVVTKIIITGFILGSSVALLDIFIRIISSVIKRKRDIKKREQRRKKAMKEKQKQSEGDMYRRLWAAEDKPCEIVYKKGINVYLNGYVATPQMADVWRKNYV